MTDRSEIKSIKYEFCWRGWPVPLPWSSDLLRAQAQREAVTCTTRCHLFLQGLGRHKASFYVLKVKVARVRLFVTPWTIQSWNSPGQNTGVGRLSLLQGIFPTQGSNPGLHIAGGFFTSWATREAQNTGVGSLSFLQGIFPTQESNQGLLHCRRIL